MKQRQFRLTDKAIQELKARESQTRDALELRRLQAVRLYGSDERIEGVQRVSGASRRTIQRWVEHYESRGIEGLKAGWVGGNRGKLNEEERTALGKDLRERRPSEVLAFEERVSTGEYWTIEDVKQWVEKRCGVRYRSLPSYHHLLTESGLSYQRPEHIYRSRPNEVVIADFEAEAEKK